MPYILDTILSNNLHITLFATLGIIAGIFSGMLGIGGGLIIVPGLFYAFQLMQFPEDTLMHLATGSSLCIMIFTCLSSIFSHHSRGAVRWAVAGKLIISIGMGVILGSVLASYLSTNWLEVIFGIFLLIISLRILIDRKPEPATGSSEFAPPRLFLTSLVGLIIGAKSGIMGLGGGTLSVPFLLYCGLSMREAVGTSASFTLPISILGTLSFLLLPTASAVSGSVGSIYYPAVILIAPFSMLGAQLGAKLSHAISTPKLRNIFAVTLIIVGFKMLAGTIQFDSFL